MRDYLEVVLTLVGIVIIVVFVLIIVLVSKGLERSFGDSACKAVLGQEGEYVKTEWQTIYCGNGTGEIKSF